MSVRVLPSTTLFKVQKNLEGLKQEEEEQRAESGLMDYRSGTVGSCFTAQEPLRASCSLCFSRLVRIEVFQVFQKMLYKLYIWEGFLNHDVSVGTNELGAMSYRQEVRQRQKVWVN